MNAAMLVFVIAMLTVAILLEALPVLAWRDMMEMGKNAQVSKTFLSGSHKYCRDQAKCTVGVLISVLLKHTVQYV